MTKKILIIIFVAMVGYAIGFVIGWKAAEKVCPRIKETPTEESTPAPADTLSEWQELQLAIALTESLYDSRV